MSKKSSEIIDVQRRSKNRWKLSVELESCLGIPVLRAHNGNWEPLAVDLNAKDSSRECN